MTTQFCPSPRRGKDHDARGFTILELVIVMMVSLTIAAVAVPGYLSIMRYLRIAGDSRDLDGLVAQAKMRAAQDFTHARVRADLIANSFQLEVWDKVANCWKVDGALTGPCTTAATPLQQRLSQGVTFGFGTAGAGGANPQAAIAQAPACSSGVAGGAAGAAYPTTACIEFNSRGRPVAANGSPTANDALYVTDTRSVYGVTVIVSGLIQMWSTGASTSSWQAR